MKLKATSNGKMIRSLIKLFSFSLGGLAYLLAWSEPHNNLVFYSDCKMTATQKPIKLVFNKKIRIKGQSHLRGLQWDNPLSADLEFYDSAGTKYATVHARSGSNSPQLKLCGFIDGYSNEIKKTIKRGIDKKKFFKSGGYMIIRKAN